MKKLNEVEAKNKWCPFADSGYMWQGFNGKVDKDIISPKCLASNCMAWIDLSPRNTSKEQKIGYCQRLKDSR